MLALGKVDDVRPDFGRATEHELYRITAVLNMPIKVSRTCFATSRDAELSDCRRAARGKTVTTGFDQNYSIAIAVVLTVFNPVMIARKFAMPIPMAHVHGSRIYNHGAPHDWGINR